MKLLGASLMVVLLIAAAALVLTGCAAPLKEVALSVPDAKDGEHFVVNRDLQNDRFWGNQTQLNGEFHCTKMRTTEELQVLRTRLPEVAHSRFDGCTPLSQHKKHQYAKMSTPGQAGFWGDGLKTIVWAGTAYVSAREIGRGLGRSGTRVEQNSSGNAQSDSDASLDSDIDNDVTAKGGSVRGPYSGKYRW